MDMTRFEVWVLSNLCRRLPLRQTIQEEIYDTARERSANQPALFRGREIGSLLGLNLRLRSNLATGENQREIFTQAAALGSTLVLFGTLAWIHASNPSASTFALALSMLAIAASNLVGYRVVGTVVQLLCGVGWLLSETLTTPVTTGLGIGVLLCVVGLGARRSTRHPTIGLLLLGLAAAYLAWSASIGLEAMRLGAVTTVAAVGPLFLLAVGWFDPRYAIAATMVWVWRLAAVDVVDVVSGASQLGADAELTLLAARWLLMGAGVLAGTAVSQRSLTRTIAL